MTIRDKGGDELKLGMVVFAEGRGYSEFGTIVDFDWFQLQGVIQVHFSFGWDMFRTTHLRRATHEEIVQYFLEV
jgi:hypothetical protein